MAARSLVAGAVSASLVTGLVLGLDAAPAGASAGGISLDPDEEVITKNSTIRVETDSALLGSELRIRGPADDEFHTVDEAALLGGLDYTFDTTCPTYAGECAGPAVNGTYTVLASPDLLSEGERARFKLRIPAAAPESFTARATDPGTVKLRWDKGAEQDLLAYRVLGSSGKAVKRVAVSDACGDGKCSAAVTVPAQDAGDQAGYSVQALRRVQPGSDETVASPATRRVTVTLPALPSPTPRKVASPSSQPGPEQGPSREQPQAGSPTPQSPGAGTPGLRPLASKRRLELPDVAGRSHRSSRGTRDAPDTRHARSAEGDRSDQHSNSRAYREQFDEPRPVLPTRKARTEPDAAHQPVPRQQTSAPLAMQPLGTPSQWWKTVALGLVLILIAAHLGAWTWRTRPAQRVSLRASRGSRNGAGAAERGPSPAAEREAGSGNMGSAGHAAGGRGSYRGRRRAD